MKELNPAKIAFICFVFLLVLYLTSGFDLAVAATFISIAFLFRLEAVWLFIVAFTSFVLYLVFTFLNLKLEHIPDLSISSYALFATGLIFYFRQGQKKSWEIKVPFGHSFNLSQANLFKMGGILLFTFLIYPVAGVWLAAILGYLAFLILFHKVHEGRFAFGIALFFLILCPFLLIGKKDKIAETSAIFTYYFLVIGVIQEIAMLIKYPEREEIFELEPKDEVTFKLRSQRIKEMRQGSKILYKQDKDSFMKIKI